MIRARANTWAPNVGYNATKFVKDKLDTDRFAIFNGQNHHQNKVAFIPASDRARGSMATVLRKNGIDAATLKKCDTMGVITPASNGVVAWMIAESIGRKYLDFKSTVVRDVDGNFPVRPPVDFIGNYERFLSGGILTPRMFYNLVASIPVVQQQASLNCGILVYREQNPDSDAGQIANFLACDVGEKWSVLPSQTPSLFGMNTLNSTTGLCHLNEDVPAAMRKFMKMNLTSASSSDDVFETVYRLGKACELAKQSAIGSLRGTQMHLNAMGDKLPLLHSDIPYLEGYRLWGAKGFFTKGAVEGAIVGRDVRSLKAMQEEASSLGIRVDEGKLKSVFNDGIKAAKSEGEQVKEIAESVSPDMSAANIEAAESEK